MAMTRRAIQTIPPAALPAIVVHLKTFYSADPHARFAVEECLLAIEEVLALTGPAYLRDRKTTNRLKAALQQLEGLGILPIPPKDSAAA